MVDHVALRVARAVAAGEQRAERAAIIARYLRAALADETTGNAVSVGAVAGISAREVSRIRSGR